MERAAVVSAAMITQSFPVIANEHCMVVIVDSHWRRDDYVTLRLKPRLGFTVDTEPPSFSVVRTNVASPLHNVSHYRLIVLQISVDHQQCLGEIQEADQK